MYIAVLHWVWYGDVIPYYGAILSAISYESDDTYEVKFAFTPYGEYKVYKSSYIDDVAQLLVPVKDFELTEESGSPLLLDFNN